MMIFVTFPFAKAYILQRRCYIGSIILCHRIDIHIRVKYRDDAYYNGN